MMKNKLKYFQNFSQNYSKWSDRALTYRIIIAIVFFGLYTTILSFNFISNKNIAPFEVGQVSERDIASPRTISYIDRVETQKLETEILAGVPDVYELDGTVISSTENNIKEIFFTARQALSYRIILPEGTRDSLEESRLPLADKKEILRNNIRITMPENVLDALNVLDLPQLLRTEEYITQFLLRHLQRGVRERDLDGIIISITEETARLNASNNEKTVIAGIAKELIRPNFLYNAEATRLNKEAALQFMEPVRKTVKKDQTLVRRGDVVTAEQIRVMAEIGLFSNTFNKNYFLGLSLFIVVLLFITGVYLYNFARSIYENLPHLILLGFIILLSLFLGKLASYYSIFIAPLAMGGLLATILINSRMGMAVCVLLSLLFTIIDESSLRAILGVLVGGIAGVYSLSISPRGHTLVRAGFFIGFASFCVIVSTGLIVHDNFMEVLIQGIYGAIGGVLSAVLATGLLPYLENTFNITSSVKLMDLARPSHPLLQRLLLEAPGTYHHSIMTGNMAESAAFNVGADANLVRVGAYYHDIGKIKRPYFFTENQMDDENPHEKMSPTLSTLVITSHVKDGVELCQEYGLPQPIIDIVKQHHGTGLASFFYQKASESTFGEFVEEHDFRYDGPKPQTKEAAIIMLADSCEAAVKSLSKPNQTRVETMVRKIIKVRLDEGQLDECDLTLKDLTVIGDVFVRILSSMFHTRMEYPDEAKRSDAINEDNNKQPPEKDTDD